MLDPDLTPPLLLRAVRLVPLDRPAPDRPVDLRVRDGAVVEVASALAPVPGERVVDADGRWALPGLWDAHVHLHQWAQSRRRLDLSGTGSVEQALARVRPAAASPGGAVVLGYGHRSATWPRRPTVAELDAVSGDHPVVLVSGDAHHGWLNSRALALLGLPPRDGVLEEDPWFAVLPHLDRLPGASDPARAHASAVAEAAARGVVGVVDMEWEDGAALWPARVAEGSDALRVEVATYPSDLSAALARGLPDGAALPGGRGLVTVGPFKVIFDGSLNTATACCRDPYPGSAGHPTSGVLNLEPASLRALLREAGDGGLRAAVHAIGDAAVGHALDALGAVGAVGASVEHAQLVARTDLPRFAALGVTASVQPAHLLDDRDVTVRLWPDRQDRCFPLRSLADAGAVLALGSDAPVAPLDPWLTLAAAVHRSGDDRPPWTPGEALTVREALAASTRGRGTLRAGGPGDLVLLDDDPLARRDGSAAAAAALRATSVAGTFLAGRATAGLWARG